MPCRVALSGRHDFAWAAILAGTTARRTISYMSYMDSCDTKTDAHTQVCAIRASVMTHMGQRKLFWLTSCPDRLPMVVGGPPARGSS
jgi:hypothetical protein